MNIQTIWKRKKHDKFGISATSCTKLLIQYRVCRINGKIQLPDNGSCRKIGWCRGSFPFVVYHYLQSVLSPQKAESSNGITKEWTTRPSLVICPHPCCRFVIVLYLYYYSLGWPSPWPIRCKEYRRSCVEYRRRCKEYRRSYVQYRRRLWHQGDWLV